TARSGVVGVLSLVMAESGRRYGPTDLTFAAELAQRAAVAIENARLHEREHEARARTERLQAVTAALARALTAAEVYDVLLREGLVAAGAAAAVVGTASADGRSIELQAHAGYPEGRLDAWQRFPLDAELPLSDAVRTLEPRFCETIEERDRVFP